VGNQKRRLARSKAIETSCVCWRLGFKFDFGREIKRATEIYSGEWHKKIAVELFKARSRVMDFFILFCKDYDGDGRKEGRRVRQRLTGDGEDDVLLSTLWSVSMQQHEQHFLFNFVAQLS